MLARYINMSRIRNPQIRPKVLTNIILMWVSRSKKRVLAKDIMSTV